jgi:hypothetical protein
VKNRWDYPAQCAGVCDAAAVEAKEAEQEKVVIAWLARRGKRVVTEPERAVLDAARAARIRTGMGGAPCTPFFIGETEAELCRAVLAWRGPR